jgi:hypothetical protein
MNFKRELCACRRTRRSIEVVASLGRLTALLKELYARRTARSEFERLYEEAKGVDDSIVLGGYIRNPRGRVLLRWLVPARPVDLVPG